ncbi:MAG: alanine--tRNA ligase [Dehalococcoidia bacterium]|nr:alanine--tRNA ligase [Dehalococcoidia bacterium]
MDGNTVRSSYIEFFEKNQHLHMPSASLIPAGDPTLLFTSAGMVPFKPFFMGEQIPPSNRLTTHQKSFRTADIEEVGDHKHLTFFEMLGNFSIGDYFKTGAIFYAWELITGVFKLDPEKIYVTVYLDDDEAYEIWKSEIGVPEDRIYRYGDKDNWWGPAGDEGPTGPCSELHYDSGVIKGCSEMMTPEELDLQLRSERDKGVTPMITGCHPNCDCERFVELWNLVFMQFYQDVDRTRSPLPAPSVDTGMGLERITAVLQGKNNVYETDLFASIVDKVCELSGISYGKSEESDFAIRVVSEHARAASFLIGDGVVPANEGRGYVLRRVIRRAIRYGRRLGLEEPFLSRVGQAVLDRFGSVYKELSESNEFIIRVITLEEERFANTYEQGNAILQDMISFRHSLSDLAIGKLSAEEVSDNVPDNRLIGDRFEKELANFVQRCASDSDAEDVAGQASTLPGEWVFLLSDTYGFPSELTSEITREHGISVDIDGFKVEIEAQRDRARAAQSFSGGMEMLTVYEGLGTGKTLFVGYDQLSGHSSVEALLVDGVSVLKATESEHVEVVLNQTPFYAESGGQVGDKGEIIGSGGYLQVLDTYSPIAGLVIHKCVVAKGDIGFGDKVSCEVDVLHRTNAARNHSATHLLHASLRSVLGPHVRQAGSHVSADRLRFDFSHVSSLTSGEQTSVQALANEKIRANLNVQTHETSYAEAVKEGALAFFGDKYGDVVRVVTIAADQAFSVEVCGGTHVSATGQIGTLFVLGETSIGGGMRRIEALSGNASERLLMDKVDTLDSLSRQLQCPVEDIEERMDGFIKDNEELKRQLTELQRVVLRQECEALISAYEEVNGVKVISANTSAPDADSLREMGDFLKAKLGSVVIVLGTNKRGNPIIVSMLTNDLVVKGMNAVDIVRNVAEIVGGGGGGNAEMAQAGGRDPSQLSNALQSVPELIRTMLK